jgi:hypothetical protein
MYSGLLKSGKGARNGVKASATLEVTPWTGGGSVTDPSVSISLATSDVQDISEIRELPGAVPDPAPDQCEQAVCRQGYGQIEGRGWRVEKARCANRSTSVTSPSSAQFNMSAGAALPGEDAPLTCAILPSSFRCVQPASVPRSPARLTLDAAHVDAFDRPRHPLPLPLPRPTPAA